MTQIQFSYKQQTLKTHNSWKHTSVRNLWRTPQQKPDTIAAPPPSLKGLSHSHTHSQVLKWVKTLTYPYTPHALQATAGRYRLCVFVCVSVLTMLSAMSHYIFFPVWHHCPLSLNIGMLYWHHRWTLFPKHLLSLCVSLSVSVGVSHPVRSNSTVKVDLLTCWAPPTSCQSLLCGFVLCVSLYWHCFIFQKLHSSVKSGFKLKALGIF